MWNLIAKDLYLQRLSMTLAVLAGIAMCSMFSSNFLGIVVLGFIILVNYTYTTFSCYHEDKNKSISFLRSLPVPARVVVNSKFAVVIMLAAAMLIPLFFLLWLGKMAGITAVSALSAHFSFIILAVLVVLLLNSIALFIFFRWGYNRMQWVYTSFLFLIPLGSVLLGRIVDKSPLFSPGISPGQGAVLGAALMLLVVFLCWKGSISALSKKDLI